MSATETARANGQPPLCRCGAKAVRYIAQRPDANMGRPFWRCAAMMSGCTFFAWADGADKREDSTVAPNAASLPAPPPQPADVQNTQRAVRITVVPCRRQRASASQGAAAQRRSAPGERARGASDEAGARKSMCVDTGKRDDDDDDDDDAWARDPQVLAEIARLERQHGATALGAASPRTPPSSTRFVNLPPSSQSHAAGGKPVGPTQTPSCARAAVAAMPLTTMPAPAPAHAQPTAPQSAGGASGTPDVVPFKIQCECPEGGMLASFFTVKKQDSQNFGRPFYSCGKRMGAPGRCKFFAWHDDIVRRHADPFAPQAREVVLHERIYARERSLLRMRSAPRPSTASPCGDAAADAGGRGATSSAPPVALPVLGLPCAMSPHPRVVRRDACIEAFAAMARQRAWDVALVPAYLEEYFGADLFLSMGCYEHKFAWVNVQPAPMFPRAPRERRDALCVPWHGPAKDDLGPLRSRHALADCMAFELADGFLLANRRLLWQHVDTLLVRGPPCPHGSATQTPTCGQRRAVVVPPADDGGHVVACGDLHIQHDDRADKRPMPAEAEEEEEGAGAPTAADARKAACAEDGTGHAADGRGPDADADADADLDAAPFVPFNQCVCPTCHADASSASHERVVWLSMQALRAADAACAPTPRQLLIDFWPYPDDARALFAALTNGTTTIGGGGCSPCMSPQTHDAACAQAPSAIQTAACAALAAAPDTARQEHRRTTAGCCQQEWAPVLDAMANEPQ